jgi:hypothetical protein
MVKWKRQQDAKSGGAILTYMQKVGKTTFTKGPFQVTHLKKLPNLKSK